MTNIRFTAMYSVSSDFVLPTWIKPDDIATYYIKYDVLHLTLKDGRSYEIQAYSSATGDDLKRPDDEDRDDECDWYEEEDDDALEDLMDAEGTRKKLIVENLMKQIENKKK
jgi:hypothetical protein